MTPSTIKVLGVIVAILALVCGGLWIYNHGADFQLFKLQAQTGQDSIAQQSKAAERLNGAALKREQDLRRIGQTRATSSRDLMEAINNDPETSAWAAVPVPAAALRVLQTARDNAVCKAAADGCLSGADAPPVPPKERK